MKDVRGVAETKSDGGNVSWRDGCTLGWTRVISVVPLYLAPCHPGGGGGGVEIGGCFALVAGG